jgi:phosphinothricin acetyltransferase
MTREAIIRMDGPSRPRRSIRLATESDAARIAAIYRPIVETTTISFETDAPKDDEMRRRIADTLPRYPWLVYELDDAVVGYAYASKHRLRAAYQWSVDTSVYVEPQMHRQGVGRALYQSLFAILAAQGFFNAFAGIALPNPPSVALHEAVGFRPVGVYRNVGHKLGTWHDVGWWQLVLRPERDRGPAPPLDLNSLLRVADWPALLAKGLTAPR